MNKTVIFLVIGAVAIIGIIGQVVLIAIRPDATATFVANTMVMLAFLVTSGTNIYQLRKQGEKLEEIERQTNGRLTAKEAHITALQTQVAETGRVPVTAPEL